MKRDLILSCVIAAAVHLSILSVPLPGGSSRDWDVYDPVSVAIIRSKKAVASPSPAETPAEVGSKPHSQPMVRALPEQTLIQERETRQEKTRAKPAIKKKEFQANIPEELATHRPAKPAPESPVPNLGESVGNASIGREPKIPDETAGNGSFSETASTANDTGQGKRRIAGTPERPGSGEGIVTYAMPRYKENPPPNYPGVARTRGYEGRTLLRVEVFETGKVGRIEITTSSGFEVLDKAALESVKGWTFVPGTKNGAKTTQWVMVPIRFCLN
jgi:protein TonB